ncbi:MAG: hypothetical protein AB7H66_16165 [Hyphomonadaceae bacterium]
MSALPTGVDRAAIKTSGRITVASEIRGVWKGSTSQAEAVTFELRERGYVRVLPGDVLKEKTDAAMASKDTAMAARLPLVLIPGRFEDSHRLPLPQVVLDRIFGANANPPSVVVRGTERYLELWSDERWAEEVDSTVSDGGPYWSK